MSLIDKYTEVFRYFSPAKRALIAITTEGAVLSRRIEDEDWRHSANKKPEIAIDDWISRKREACAKLPAWATQVEELPSFDDVQFWIVDGICPTPTGDEVEPDGHGPDGAPSWLLALGLI